MECGVRVIDTENSVWRKGYGHRKLNVALWLWTRKIECDVTVIDTENGMWRKGY